MSILHAIIDGVIRPPFVRQFAGLASDASLRKVDAGRNCKVVEEKL
jgi:hypothetical protein